MVYRKIVSVPMADSSVVEVAVPEVADHTPQVYSKESERLVKQSWEVLKKDPQTNGIVFFTK